MSELEELNELLNTSCLVELARNTGVHTFIYRCSETATEINSNLSAQFTNLRTMYTELSETSITDMQICTFVLALLNTLSSVNDKQQLISTEFIECRKQKA